MSDGGSITPKVAEVLARWASLDETLSDEKLAEILEGVRQVVDRLYAVDVEQFEADYLIPDARER